MLNVSLRGKGGSSQFEHLLKWDSGDSHLVGVIRLGYRQRVPSDSASCGFDKGVECSIDGFCVVCVES